MICKIDEGRIALDAKLLSTVIWSQAMFRQFESPLYDDILRGLKQRHLREFDQESVRRLYQVAYTKLLPFVVRSHGILSSCKLVAEVSSGSCADLMMGLRLSATQSAGMIAEADPCFICREPLRS